LRRAALCAIATLFVPIAAGCGSSESAGDGAQLAPSSDRLRSL